MTTYRARLASNSVRERGFGTLEAVIAIPVVVMLTMLVIQVVMIYHARNVTQAAAADGLRVARGYQATAVQGETAAEQYLASVAPKLLDHPHCHVRRGRTTVLIVCDASVASVVPFGSYTVTEQAHGSVERFHQ